jgi:hypothetical protein
LLSLLFFGRVATQLVPQKGVLVYFATQVTEVHLEHDSWVLGRHSLDGLGLKKSEREALTFLRVSRME